MEDAFKKVGITDKLIKRGEIYLIPDRLIVYPKTRIPEQPPREEHENRPVLIIQTDFDNQDFYYPIVLIAPLSSRVDLKDDKDYELTEGQGGVSKDSLIQLGLVQPILKIELMGKSLGSLDPIMMSDIDAVLAANIGLIARPTKLPPSQVI